MIEILGSLSGIGGVIAFGLFVLGIILVAYFKYQGGIKR